MEPKIVSQEDWLAARKALLAEERALIHHRDRVAAERRALPWVKVETAYVFDSPEGPKSLADLFEGRSQLFVHYFMLPPGSDHICPACAAMSDHVDAARRHFQQADLSYAAVSRAPLARIQVVKARLGWTFQWVSSAGNRFNYDYGAAFTPEQIAAGAAGYNYGTTNEVGEDMPAASVFARNAAGEVFHTYSAYARGTEALFTPFNFLDFAPKGRNEDGGVMSWVRLHDEYDAPPAEDAACCEGAR